MATDLPLDGPQLDGFTPPANCRLRLLTRADLAAMLDLHRAILAEVPPGAVRPERPEFFAMLLGGGGLVPALVDPAGRLAGYAVLQYDLAEETELIARLSLPPPPSLIAPQRLAKLAGAAVRADWRGGDLQYHLTRLRLALARADGVSHLFATVGIDNPPSYRSLLRAGLIVTARIETYGGLLRYLLEHDLAAGPVAMNGRTPICIAAESHDAIAAALAVGRRIVGYRAEGAATTMLLE